jgi:transcriptional regulator with XRE-family HTH domain
MDVRYFHSFAELIRELRATRHVSQRGLAKMLAVSAGYVGQWELGLSQPAPEMVDKLCEVFNLQDRDYVQRLAYACRAPEWLRDSIIHYRPAGEAPTKLSGVERRMLTSIRQLEATEKQRLAEKIEGWVEAVTEEERR